MAVKACYRNMVIEVSEKSINMRSVLTLLLLRTRI